MGLFAQEAMSEDGGSAKNAARRRADRRTAGGSSFTFSRLVQFLLLLLSATCLIALAQSQPIASTSTTKSRNIVFDNAGGVTREMRWKSQGRKGLTVWMTGLSGAGKSTISKHVEQMLFENGASSTLSIVCSCLYYIDLQPAYLHS